MPSEPPAGLARLRLRLAMVDLNSTDRVSVPAEELRELLAAVDASRAALATLDEERAQRDAAFAELAAVRIDPDALGAARRAGAQEMRETAAEIFDEIAGRWGNRVGRHIYEYYAQQIRRLPLPGDAP